MTEDLARAGARARKGVALTILAAMALAALVDYGLDGLFGFAFLLLLAVVSLRLGREEGGKRRGDELGPFDYHRRYDPAVRYDPIYRGLYPWIFRDDEE